MLWGMSCAPFYCSRLSFYLVFVVKVMALVSWFQNEHPIMESLQYIPGMVLNRCGSESCKPTE